ARGQMPRATMLAPPTRTSAAAIRSQLAGMRAQTWRGACRSSRNRATTAWAVRSTSSRSAARVPSRCASSCNLASWNVASSFISGTPLISSPRGGSAPARHRGLFPGPRRSRRTRAPAGPAAETLPAAYASAGPAREKPRQRARMTPHQFGRRLLVTALPGGDQRRVGRARDGGEGLGGRHARDGRRGRYGEIKATMAVKAPLPRVPPLHTFQIRTIVRTMRPYDERLDRFLSRAAKVFADQGYHSTTMRDLAA